MATPSSDNVMLGRGAIFFDKFDANGARTGFRHLGNCDSLAIGIQPEKLEMTDYTQESSAPYKEVVIKTDVPLSISGFEFDKGNLELLFMGDSTTYTQTLQTVTSEQLAGAAATGLKGKFFQTAYRDISSVVLKQGAATLVEGTDYEVFSAKAGMIRMLPSSATVVDGTALTVDYSAAAIVEGLEVVRGATRSQVEGRLYYLPRNTTGPQLEVTVWRASLAPNGEINLISDEFAKWQLEGKVLSDAAGQYGGSTLNPFFQTLRQAA